MLDEEDQHDQQAGRWVGIGAPLAAGGGRSDHRSFPVKGTHKRNGLEGRLLILAGLYVLARVLRSGELAASWPAGHLADLLCLPLVLGGLLLVRRRTGKPPAWTLPSGQAWLAAILFSVYFEFILPGWNASVTGDLWDVVMYFGGLVLFQLWINRPGAVPTDSAPLKRRSLHGYL